jgi:hypothetical protein
MLVGAMSATLTSMVVNIKTETGAGSLDVLQQSQRQNEAMASQSICQNKLSLAGVLCSFSSYLKQICFFLT